MNEVLPLLQTVCNYLEKNLKPSSCLEIYNYADVSHCHDLKLAADSYIMDHFMKVKESKEFLQLTSEQLCRILSSDEVAVDKEETLYEAVNNWVQHDPCNRANDLRTIMTHIRFPLMKKDYLLTLEKLSPNEYKDFIDLALSNQQNLSVALPKCRPLPPKLLITIGGWPKAISKSVEVYDVNKEYWRIARDMDRGIYGHGIGVVGGKVYAVGGVDGSTGNELATCTVYDPSHDTWKSLACMGTPRRGHGVAGIKDCIYAVGGLDQKTCEVYDLATIMWRNISPMHNRRWGVGLGAVGNKLFAVGGKEEGSVLNSVERYDPDKDSWTYITPMAKPKWFAGVGVINNTLYVVGGLSDGPVLKSVDSYNAETDTWCRVRDMNVGRYGAAVVAQDGLLYVLGGKANKRGQKHLSTMEVYDPSTNRWTILSNTMIREKSSMGAALIDKPI